MSLDARRALVKSRLHRAIAVPELEELYRKLFMPLVRRAGWKHGLTKEDASDVVQDAFALAVVKLNDDGNPASWLIGVVDRLSVNLQRTAIRRTDLMAKWMPCSDESADDAGSDSDWEA